MGSKEIRIIRPLRIPADTNILSHHHYIPFKRTLLLLLFPTLLFFHLAVLCAGGYVEPTLFLSLSSLFFQLTALSVSGSVSIRSSLEWCQTGVVC